MVQAITGWIERRIGRRALRRADQWRSLLERSREEDADWDWSSILWEFAELQRLGKGAYVGFTLWALDDVQALLLMEVGGAKYPGVADGSPQGYLEYLAVAPQNRGTIQEPRLLRGCGTVLLEAAMHESYRRGWKGRVSLHSLPGSLVFYRRQGFRDYGPDPHEGGCHYLERSGTLS